MPITLPPSLRRDLHPLKDEVAWARGLTPEERLRITARLCRDAMTLLGINPNRERILAHRDPVPDSTRRALLRLRAR